MKSMRVNPKDIIRIYNRNRSVSEVVQELGIHKTTVYRWLKRARSPHPYGAPKYLQKYAVRKNTAPKKKKPSVLWNHRVDIEELYLKKRYDVRKIKHILKLDCSHMTIYRYLKRRGHIKDKGRHRRPYMQNTVHMHARNTKKVGYLQMDVKFITPQLSGLPWTCYEYAVIDIYSRYKEAVILNQLDQSGSIVALLEILPKLPFTPIFLQTDNGLEFQAKFKEFVEANGMEYHYIHKRSPNENAVIERSFRTDQDEFFYRLESAPQHYDELRHWFADYLHEYNTARPHFGIDLKTPYEVVQEALEVI